MSQLVLGVIPARLASTRLPRKPLHPILGRPLIEWVWRRAESMTALHHAVVATDSAEVAEVCQAIGAPVELTSPDHVCGTDRVAEVARLPSYSGFGAIVNIQGDQPLMDEAHVRAAVELVVSAGWEIGTCATPILSERELSAPSAVKLIMAADGEALWFSRSQWFGNATGLGHAGDSLGSVATTAPFRHVGIYSYTRAALFRWASLDPASPEVDHSLEQLRPLGAGMRIGVAVVDAAAPGVDTPADVLRLERVMRREDRTSRPSPPNWTRCQGPSPSLPTAEKA